MTPVEVERVLHFPGELLRGRDLRAQVGSDAERMWWHQRAVHDVVGAIAGLGVRSDGGGNVIISPGIGYDPRGHEVVLSTEASIPAPTDKRHAYALVLHACACGPARPAWVRIDCLERCNGVPIARWMRGVLGLWPGSARPLARPRFASGATLPGSTAWEPWLALERRTRAFGLEVAIDTTAAGFTGRPVYLAWLQWPGIASQDPRIATLSLGLQHAGDETPDGFTFRVVVVALAVGAQRLFRQIGHGRANAAIVTWARTQRLSVAWVGIEDEIDDGGDG